MGRFLRFLPLYIVLLTTFGIFLYLLPGMSDPEISTTKRIPFLILNYFIVLIISLGSLNLNGLEILENGSSGFIVFFPILQGLTVHLITLVSDIDENRSEVMIVTAILLEMLFICMEWNDSIIIRLTIAIMTWGYIYYCVMFRIRMGKL